MQTHLIDFLNDHANELTFLALHDFELPRLQCFENEFVKNLYQI